MPFFGGCRKDLAPKISPRNWLADVSPLPLPVPLAILPPPSPTGHCTLPPTSPALSAAPACTALNAQPLTATGALLCPDAFFWLSQRPCTKDFPHNWLADVPPLPCLSLWLFCLPPHLTGHCSLPPTSPALSAAPACTALNAQPLTATGALLCPDKAVATFKPAACSYTGKFGC
jgi:hypothetical protein